MFSEETLDMNNCDFYRCVKIISSYSGCTGWTRNNVEYGYFAVERGATASFVESKMKRLFHIEKMHEINSSTGVHTTFMPVAIDIKV